MSECVAKMCMQRSNEAVERIETVWISFDMPACMDTRGTRSIDCLHGASKPTVVVLHEERHCRLIKTYVRCYLQYASLSHVSLFYVWDCCGST